jgi:hypothetical protein
MKWTRSILKNLAIPADALDHLRQLAWLTVNRSDFVDYKINMRVSGPEAKQPSSAIAAVPSSQAAIL